MLVGEHQTPFFAHEALICGSSDLFKTALRERRQPAAIIARLKDVDVSLFQLYMQWLYNQDSGDDDDDHRPRASQTRTKFTDLTPGGAGALLCAG